MSAIKHDIFVKKLSIAKKFSEDHDHILETLLKYINNNSSREENPRFLKEFIWMVERHFYLEEKAILHFFQIDADIEKQFLIRLYHEHSSILKILNRIRKNISYDPYLTIEAAMSELKVLVANHKKFEMENFYIQMDKRLAEHQRAYLLKILDHSVHSGFFPLSKLREEALSFFQDFPEIVDELNNS
ncbi:hemerythrin domain-containing protein [Candidatus Harpocratesius sp.]